MTFVPNQQHPRTSDPPSAMAGRIWPVPPNLRRLFDRSPDPVCRFDSNLRLTYVNLAAARSNNRPTADFYGKTLRELGHTEQLVSIVEKNLREAIESGKALTFDVDYDGPFGLKKYRCRLVPEHQDGANNAVMLFCRDITDAAANSHSNREQPK